MVSILPKFFKGGWSVVRSSLKDGQDFFTYNPGNFDVIVSNPPFNIKDQVLAKLYEKVLEKFSRMVVETDNDSNSVSYYENSFCISSERYRMIEKLIANHFYGSKFEKIIYKLIGNYHFNYGFVRFSKDDQALLIHSANVYREWKKNSLVGKDGNEK